MRRTRWSLVLLGVLFTAVPARAQCFVWYNPAPYDYEVAGGSISFKHGHHHTTLSISVGAFTTRPIVVAPLYGLYPPALLPTPLLVPVVNQQVTAVSYS